MSQTGSGPQHSGPQNKDQAAEITILPDSERVTARPEETLLRRVLPLGFVSGFVVKLQAGT